MTAVTRLSGLARGGLLNLTGALGAGLAGVALVAVVARGYPADVAGAFFAATSVFLITSAACELGSDVGLVRWLPRYLAQERFADARRCLRVALAPVAVVVCVLGAALVLAAPWVSEVLSGDESPERITAMLRVFGLFLPVTAVRNALLSATRGYGTMRPTVVIEKLGRTLAQVVGAAITSWLGGGAVALALAWSVPYMLGGVGAGWWFAAVSRDATSSLAHGEGGAPRPARELAGEFWRYTSPRAVAHVCQVALQRADIFLVAALRSPEEAAIYTVATRFVVIGQLGAQAVHHVLQPAISRALTLREYAVATQVFRTATTWILALTVPIYALAAGAAPLYLSLIGGGPPDTAKGAGVVVILAPAMVLAAAAGPVDVMLLMAGRSGLSLINNLAALVVNLAVAVALVPPLGVSGAALAWACGLGVRNLVPLVQVRVLLRMSPFSPGSWLVLVSAVLSFGILPLAVGRTFGLDPVPVLVAVVIACVAYAGALWLLRGRLGAATLLARNAAADEPAEISPAPRDS